MSFQVTHNSFAITFGSTDDFFFFRILFLIAKADRNCELKVCVKVPKKAKREREI